MIFCAVCRSAKGSKAAVIGSCTLSLTSTMTLSRCGFVGFQGTGHGTEIVDCPGTPWNAWPIRAGSGSVPWSVRTSQNLTRAVTEASLPRFQTRTLSACVLPGAGTRWAMPVRVIIVVFGLAPVALAFERCTQRLDGILLCIQRQKVFVGRDLVQFIKQRIGVFQKRPLGLDLVEEFAIADHQRAAVERDELDLLVGCETRELRLLQVARLSPDREILWCQGRVVTQEGPERTEIGKGDIVFDHRGLRLVCRVPRLELRQSLFEYHKAESRSHH